LLYESAAERFAEGRQDASQNDSEFARNQGRAR
jgi:hypothetical protein